MLLRGVYGVDEENSVLLFLVLLNKLFAPHLILLDYQLGRSFLFNFYWDSMNPTLFNISIVANLFTTEALNHSKSICSIHYFVTCVAI